MCRKIESLLSIAPEQNRTEQKVGFDKKRISLAKILAIIVIVFELVAIAIIGRNAFLNNELAHNKLAAIYLAQDGMDAINSIRDGNYLKYHGDCWNSISGTDENDCANNLIQDSTYYALKSNDDSEYYLEDTDAGDDLFDDSYCYEEGFYRNVYIKYDTGDPSTASSIVATVTVGWISNGEEETYTLMREFYNWMK